MTLTVERKHSALFGPADAGEWSLPRPIIEARETVARLTAAYSAIPQAPSWQALNDAAVTAAMKSADPGTVDISALLDYPRLTTERDTIVEVLRVAGERANATLGGLVFESRDLIISGHLRPAGDKLWSAVIKATKALGDIDTSQTNALLRAPSPARHAWLELDDLALRYGRIREAVSRLLLHSGAQPQHDTDADHAEFEEGLCTLAGPGWKGLPMAEKRPTLPWPTDPRSRLVWFARKGVQPWWPTIEERDAAWMVTHKAGYERMQQQQQRHRTTQAWGKSFV